jgi:hypothetical protein
MNSELEETWNKALVEFNVVLDCRNCEDGRIEDRPYRDSTPVLPKHKAGFVPYRIKTPTHGGHWTVCLQV